MSDLKLENTERNGPPKGAVTITVGSKSVTWPSRLLRRQMLKGRWVADNTPQGKGEAR